MTISSTTPTAGVSLSVTGSFSDAEGVNVASIRFNWQRETATGVWETASGDAVGDTYIPGNAEVGLRLRVVATFLDNAGNPETIISAPTGPWQHRWHRWRRRSC